MELKAQYLRHLEVNSHHQQVIIQMWVQVIGVLDPMAQLVVQYHQRFQLRLGVHLVEVLVQQHHLEKMHQMENLNHTKLKRQLKLENKLIYQLVRVNAKK
jgi:hypothetical protein